MDTQWQPHNHIHIGSANRCTTHRSNQTHSSTTHAHIDAALHMMRIYIYMVLIRAPKKRTIIIAADDGSGRRKPNISGEFSRVCVCVCVILMYICLRFTFEYASTIDRIWATTRVYRISPKICRIRFEGGASSDVCVCV